jgi:hypothetical protein
MVDDRGMVARFSTCDGKASEFQRSIPGMDWPPQVYEHEESRLNQSSRRHRYANNGKKVWKLVKEDADESHRDLKEL